MLILCKYHLPEKCLTCITLQAWDKWWQNTHNAMSKCNVRRKPNIMPENVAYCIATEVMLKKENLLLLVCFWEFGCVVLKKVIELQDTRLSPWQRRMCFELRTWACQWLHDILKQIIPWFCIIHKGTFQTLLTLKIHSN